MGGTAATSLGMETTAVAISLGPDDPEMLALLGWIWIGPGDEKYARNGIRDGAV